MLPGRRSSPSLRWLLLGVSVFALVVPVVAFLTQRIYDTYLLRQTERQLIAQAVVIGEAWREALRDVRGHGTLEAIQPPGRRDHRFVPIEPVIDLTTQILPPQPTITAEASDVDPAYLEAGRRMEPLLRRAQTFNLSAVRILDSRGCVISTSRSERGLCLSSLPEVQDALGGAYSARARRRISDEPLPSVSEVRRRGDVRIFTALPVFDNGEVIGVVRISRTSLDALTSLWLNRRGLIAVAGITGTLLLGISLLSARAIASPLQRLTRRAKAIADGNRSSPENLGWAPQEVQELAEAFDTMTQRLQERARYISEFASNVSHELKTPLTGIRGATELLREKWESMGADQRERFLANVESDAQRMDHLVGRLLELARLENADPSADEPVAVEAVLRSIAERYDAQLRLDAPPAVIRIPPEHLVSAVTNLLDNARRHGGDKPVLLHATSDEGRLRLEVTDQGPGISPGNRSRIFQRFFTTERDRGGTGLGLAMVKAVAEGRGGSIAFDTGPGGTRFTLIL
ncbi:MAG: ATP-binding protein [Myxococcota bacterium]